MDAERVLLSCPGRVQDWLGAAVDQIETLLHVPLPSLSGSDEAIGALRIKRERPSRATGPYNLRSKNGGSGASPTANWGSLSVSSDELLCAEKSPSRCENCVAEKGSRCSRDLPSCARCHKNGMFCFYLEGAPAGCRKPQGRRRERSRISERGSGLPREPLSATPVSGIPASEYPQPSLEQHLTVPPVNSPTGVSSVTALTKHQCQTAAVKPQVTMLPATPTISTLPLGTRKLEAPLESAGAELDVVANGLRSSLVTGSALAAAEHPICQGLGSGEKRNALEVALQKCVDDETQQQAADVVVLPLHPRYPRQASTVSSLATTPFASTLGSRSTSQSSETESLPITPAAELSTPLCRTNAERAVGTDISSSQAAVSHATPSASHEVSSTGDAETHLSHLEELVDLYLLSHQKRQAGCDAEPSTDPQDRSFSDGFLEELFEEGEAAKKLVELQRLVPEGGKLQAAS